MPQLYEEIAYLLAEREGLEPAPLAGITPADAGHLARVRDEILLGTASNIGVSALIAQADSRVKMEGHLARLSAVELYLLQYRVNTPEGKLGLAAGAVFRGYKRAAEIRELEKIKKPLDYDSLQYIERKRIDELAVSPVVRGVVKYDNENYHGAADPRGEIWAALLQRIGASKAEEILQGVTAYANAQRKIARLREEQAKEVADAQPAWV